MKDELVAPIEETDFEAVPQLCVWAHVILATADWWLN
jgi:hypothetical protein